MRPSTTAEAGRAPTVTGSSTVVHPAVGAVFSGKYCACKGKASYKAGIALQVGYGKGTKLDQRDYIILAKEHTVCAGRLGLRGEDRSHLNRYWQGLSCYASSDAYPGEAIKSASVQ